MDIKTSGGRPADADVQALAVAVFRLHRQLQLLARLDGGQGGAHGQPADPALLGQR